MIVSELFAKLGFDFDQGAFRRAEGALKGLGIAVAGVGALVAGIAASIGYATKTLTDYGVEVSQAAQRTGLTTDAFQELSGAAKLAQVPAEALDRGLRQLSHTIYEASQGNVMAAISLGQVGAATRDVNGKFLTTDKILENVADRFAKMPEGLRKVALARALFARGGPFLIPFLNQGAKGIQQLRKVVRDSGAVMSEELIAKSKEAARSSAYLSLALQGLKNKAIGPLIGRMNALKGATADWIIANGSLIASKFLAFLDDVKKAFNVIRIPIDALIDDLQMHLGPTLLVAGALFLGLKREAVEAALASMWAWISATWPLLVITGGVIALILLMQSFFRLLEGRQNIFSEIWKLAKVEFVDKWVDGFKSLKDSFVGFFKYIVAVGTDILAPILLPIQMLAGLLGAGAGYAKGTVDTQTQMAGLGSPGALFSSPDSYFSPNAQSPSASAAASQSSDGSAGMSFSMGDINVTATSSDPQAIAGAITEQIQAFHDDRLREANASLPQPLY